MTVLCCCMYAQSTVSSNTLLWQTEIDVATAETQREDASLTPLSDGSFLGVYTSGAGEKIYRGMVRKISATGETVWETELQPSVCSVADCASETKDGSIMVAGTTIDGGCTKLFVALLSADGTVKATKVLDNGYASGFTLKILPWGDDKYVTCSYMTSTDGYTYNVFNIIDSNLNVSEYIRKNANAEMRDAYVIDNYMVSSSFEQIMAVDLTDPTKMHTLSGNYDRSVQIGNTLCIPSNKGLSSAITMKCYTIGAEGFNEKWSTSLSTEGILWKHYVNYTYAIDKDVYLVTKDDTRICIVKFDSEGKATVIGDNVLNKSRYFDHSDFIYGFGISPDGSLHLLGMTSWKVFVANFDAKGNLTSERELVPDADYSWAYTLYNQSIFSDGKFNICGFMLRQNAESEFTTYFAEIDPENKIKPTTWCSVATMGKVVNIYPVGEAADTDGNLYVSAQSGKRSYLLKYSDGGELLWTAADIPFKGDKLSISHVAALTNGNVVIYGITENQSTWKYENYVACFNPQGEMVWSEQFGDDNVCSKAVAAGMTVDDSNIRIFYNGYLNNDGGLTGLTMTTLGHDGAIRETKTLPIQGYRFRVAFVKSLSDNQLIAGGYAFSEDYIFRPVAIVFNHSGEIVSKSISDKYENDGNYTYSDAELSSDGKIFLSGMSYNSSSSKGIYAVIDSEGNYVAQSEALPGGYFRSCAAYGNTGLMFGSFEDTEQNQVKGRIVSLSSSGEIGWDKEFAIDDRYETYFLFGFGNDKQITIAGFTEDYQASVLTETMFTVDTDSRDMTATPSISVDNADYNYEMTNAMVSQNRLFTLSKYSMPFDSSLKTGSINCFKSDNIVSSIERHSYTPGISVERGIITVTGKQVFMSVHDMGGRLLCHTYGNRLDASSLGKGNYIVTIIYGNERIALKLAI